MPLHGGLDQADRESTIRFAVPHLHRPALIRIQGLQGGRDRRACVHFHRCARSRRSQPATRRQL
jgi:hypothetical protein